MNGYELMAESYRYVAAKGEISQEEADKECKVFDFLATCDDEDICNLFDSAAFNDIAKSYMRRAVKELVEEGTIDEEQGRAVRNRFSLLFDEIRAHEVTSEKDLQDKKDIIIQICEKKKVFRK